MSDARYSEAGRVGPGRRGRSQRSEAGLPPGRHSTRPPPEPLLLLWESMSVRGPI